LVASPSRNQPTDIADEALYQRNELIAPPNEYPKLFIISSTEALKVAETIRASLESDVFSTVWNQGVFFAGGYSLEALEKAVSESDFAIAIAQADDIIESRGGRQPTLRDNVLFELGLFMGRLGRHRALLIHPKVEGLKLPSDLQGLTLLRYEPGEPNELPKRLKAACDEIRKIVKSLGVRTLLSQAGSGRVRS
jgi:predicted nucleotide-binding protein